MLIRVHEVSTSAQRLQLGELVRIEAGSEVCDMGCELVNLPRVYFLMISYKYV